MSKKFFQMMFPIKNVEKISQKYMGIFGGGGFVCRRFWKKINIFACTCPNRSGVGAIDNLDRFEQVFDTYYIPEASENNFTDDISMVRPQKMYIFGVLKAFISKFTYYNLYSRKFKVIERRKYAIRFFVRALHFL